MAGLHDTMVTFHTKVGGDISKIEALFVDMAPEPQKGKPMPPGRISRLVLGLLFSNLFISGMIHALLRVGQADTTCSVKDFLDCFRRNLDATDTVEKLKPVFEAHNAKY